MFLHFYFCFGHVLYLYSQLTSTNCLFPSPSHVGALFPVSLLRAFPTARRSPGGSRPSGSRTRTGTASCEGPPTDRAIKAKAASPSPRRGNTTVMILSKPPRMMTAKRTRCSGGWTSHAPKRLRDEPKLPLTDLSSGVRACCLPAFSHSNRSCSGARPNGTGSQDDQVVRSR